jgi:peptidoglycan/LPS O-acetylase OafA/YrhL
MQTKNLKLIFPAAVVMILLTFAATFKINPILAETGKGKDIFKVITTIRMLFSNYVIYVD